MKLFKDVIYNGNTASVLVCSSHRNLVRGHAYTVVYVQDKGWQTDYILDGIEGHYCSEWFEEAKEVIYATSNHFPVVDGKYRIYHNGTGILTENVRFVEYVTSDCVKVVTKDKKVYVVIVK